MAEGRGVSVLWVFLGCLSTLLIVSVVAGVFGMRVYSASQSFENKGGVQMVLQVEVPADVPLGQRTGLVQQATDILTQRVNGLKVRQSEVTLGEDGRVVVRLPGVTESVRLIRTLTQKGQLAFTMVAPSSDAVTKESLVGLKPALDGAVVEDAQAQDDIYGGYVVMLTFSKESGQEFCEITGAHIGQRMAITIDGDLLIAPTIREGICGGQAQIMMGVPEGDPKQAAEDLALVLRSGALPVAVKMESMTAVEPVR
jgi:preprotein translocase subunit SecD